MRQRCSATGVLETKLKQLIKEVSLRSQKWAQAKEDLEEATDKQKKLEALVDALGQAQEYLDGLQEPVFDVDCEMGDATYKEEKARERAERASAQLAEHVAWMYRNI